MKGISSLCTFMIPIAGTVYMCACTVLLIIHHQYILPSVLLIVRSAFQPCSIFGGVLGASVSSAVRYGISRGLFTNESGMGSTPIFSASSKCNNLEQPSIIAMLSVFLDTVIICSITGIVFVSCLLRVPSLGFIQHADQFALSCFSFLPVFGRQILCLSIVLFALSTVFGWCIIGERLLQFIFGIRAVNWYRILWLLFVFSGCIFQLSTIWSFSDFFNALMCLPNIIMLYHYRHEIHAP